MKKYKIIKKFTSPHLNVGEVGSVLLLADDLAETLKYRGLIEECTEENKELRKETKAEKKPKNNS